MGRAAQKALIVCQMFMQEVLQISTKARKRVAQKTEALQISTKAQKRVAQKTKVKTLEEWTLAKARVKTHHGEMPHGMLLVNGTHGLAYLVVEERSLLKARVKKNHGVMVHGLLLVHGPQALLLHGTKALHGAK